MTELEPELQKMVDEGKIGMTPAVESDASYGQDQTILSSFLHTATYGGNYHQAAGGMDEETSARSAKINRI